MTKTHASALFRAACYIFIMAGLLIAACPARSAFASQISITDAMGRAVSVPESPKRVICSGPGCLRLLTYLQAEDRAVAVDDMEKREVSVDPRPYALANPQFKELPIFGEFRGQDNPELIAALEPAPQVIFKTFAGMGTDPAKLQQKTGIPVVTLIYGDLSEHKDELYQSLRQMGKILGKTKRAEAVIAYFNQTIRDLKSRTASVAEPEKPSCYVGGIAFKGPHGFQSTEPTYPPFMYTRAKNVAYNPDKSYGALSHASVAKEKIIAWNPEVLFLDLSSIASAPGFSALEELKTEPAYQYLQAVKAGRVYGVLPYNWYAQNFGATLADAFYVGKILYPERFSDIDPEKKADRIFEFLVGAPVFEQMDAAFGGLVFDPVLD